MKQANEPGFAWKMAALLAAALGLRLWGIGFCLPMRYGHIDETAVIFYTMKFFSGNLDPQVFYDYPTLHLYMLFAVLCVYFSLGRAGGLWNGVDQFWTHYELQPTGIYLTCRGVSALFGVATVWLTFKIADRFWGRRAAWISAVLVAAAPLHALHSHYATVDISAAFFNILAVWTVLEAWREPSGLKWALAGLAIGAGAATKYYTGLLVLPAAGLVLAGAGAWKRKWAWAALMAAASIGGFVVGCPYSIGNMPAFWSRFADRYALIVGSGGGLGWRTWLHAGGSVFDGMQPMLSILAVTGGAALLWTSKSKGANTAESGRRSALALLVLCAGLFAVMGSWKIFLPRYSLAFLPAAAILAGAGLSKIADMGHLIRISVAALFLVTFGIQAASSISDDIILARPDTRLVAVDWMRKSLPPGSRILRGPFTPEFTPNDNFKVFIDWDGTKWKNKTYREISRNFDYALTSSFYKESPEFEKQLDKATMVTIVLPHRRSDRNGIITAYSSPSGFLSASIRDQDLRAYRAKFGTSALPSPQSMRLEFHNPVVCIWKLKNQ